MNWINIIFQLVYCLHCCCVGFVVHSKHFKNNNNNNQNNNNKNFDNSFWFNRLSDQNQDYKHRITEHDLWNSYQSYQPSVDDGMALTNYEDISTERPPYYLSYDSGIKTRFQAMEEKLIQQQMNQQDGNDDQDSEESNTRTNINRFELPSKKLLQDKYQYQIESQIKERQEMNEKHNQNQREENRKVGPKGLGGTFGFMMGQHFFPCDKPAFLEPDPQTGDYLIPESIGYYHQCQYFDDDPRRQFQRQVGALGVNSYYGYYCDGRFIECAPPKRLDQDTQDPDLYYIPNDIEYEPKCLYYGFNVSKRFEASSDHQRSFGELSVKTIDNFSIILLPFYVLTLILSYF